MHYSKVCRRLAALGHLRRFERPLEMSAMRPIATKNGEPVKRRRRARSRRRAAARERQAPVEGPAPPLAWPVVHSAAAEVRRFPPPWTVEETDACFIVRDANGRALAYVYFEDEPGRRAAAKLLTRDGARRIAADIDKLPELLLHHCIRGAAEYLPSFSNKTERSS